jgi:imidazolonepropionase-like amidohydrolase
MIRFLWLAMLVCIAASARADDDVRILRHATVIDATSPVARGGMSIVIAGGHIVRLDHDEQIDLADYPGARLEDLSGRFVLPGLVETHIHLATSPDIARAESILARLVRGGVTTVRDMAGDARFLADLRRRVLIGDLTGPEIQYSAIMAGPSFFDDPRTAAASQGESPGDVAWLQAIDADTDMTIAVARASGTGARGIKIYANLPAETVARIGAAAQAQDMRLWSHATIAPALPMDAVEAGVNVVSHACMLVSHISPLHPQAYPSRPDADFTVFGDDYSGYADLFAAMRRHGTLLDANLRLYALADARRAETPDDPPLIRCPLDYAAGIVAAAHVAGIPITTGTDGIAPPENALPSIHDELVLLHDAVGLTPHEVITAATFNGARALGMRTEIGLVLPGYQADLLVLSANPLEDIANLRAIDQVMIDGQFAIRNAQETGSEP